MFASHHNLSNITVCIDNNNLQSLTTLDDTISLSPLSNKLSSFGWDTITIDGHDHQILHDNLLLSKTNSKPTALILSTVKGKGVSFMENSVDWHYKSPNDSELQKALEEIANQ